MGFFEGFEKRAFGEVYAGHPEGHSIIHKDGRFSLKSKSGKQLNFSPLGKDEKYPGAGKQHKVLAASGFGDPIYEESGHVYQGNHEVEDAFGDKHKLHLGATPRAKGSPKGKPYKVDF